MDFATRPVDGGGGGGGGAGVVTTVLFSGAKDEAVPDERDCVRSGSGAGSG